MDGLLYTMPAGECLDRDVVITESNIVVITAT